MTSVFQGLSPSCSVGWVGENPGNKVERNLVAKVATQQEFLIAKEKMLVTLAPVSVAIEALDKISQRSNNISAMNLLKNLYNIYFFERSI